MIESKIANSHVVLIICQALSDLSILADLILITTQ